jgi:HSP20 family protein
MTVPADQVRRARVTESKRLKRDRIPHRSTLPAFAWMAFFLDFKRIPAATDRFAHILQNSVRTLPNILMNFIQRYQPALSWVNEIDRLIDRNLRHPSSSAAQRESLHESENAWILRIDLPGYSKEEVRLSVTENTLSLLAETPADRPFGGRYERQWKLGKDIDGATTAARLENGVLELTIPKKAETIAQPISIPIN